MKIGLYAGSFDPWSSGHEYVLRAALTVFDQVHVLVAVNPSKQGVLDSVKRAQAIAHSAYPLARWESQELPYSVQNKIIINTTPGLVISYAHEHNITHLIRGLRSTSDFESEFSLYFSNLAIDSSVQTWCVMCPPELLHCSSTFIKNVVGKVGINFIGASFYTQSLLLRKQSNISHLLDVAMWYLQKTFNNTMFENGFQRFYTEMCKLGYLDSVGADRVAGHLLDLFIDKHKNIGNIFESSTVIRDANWIIAAIFVALQQSDKEIILSEGLVANIFLDKLGAAGEPYFMAEVINKLVGEIINEIS